MKAKPHCGSNLAACRSLWWGLSQQPCQGGLGQNLWHTCLPQAAMPRGPQPKIFSTIACCRSPCQGGLGQKSLAHLPAIVYHAERASAKNLWCNCLPQAAMLRGPQPKIFSTLACCIRKAANQLNHLRPSKPAKIIWLDTVRWI